MEKLTSDETLTVEAPSGLTSEKEDNDGTAPPCPSNLDDNDGTAPPCPSNLDDDDVAILPGSCNGYDGLKSQVVPPDAIIEVTVTLDVHLGEKKKKKSVELNSDDDDDDLQVVFDDGDPDYRTSKKIKKRPTRPTAKRKRPTINDDGDDESEDGLTLCSVITNDPGVFQYGQCKFKELVKSKKYECLECHEFFARRPGIIRHIHSAHILERDKFAPDVTVMVDDDGVFHFKNWKFVKTNSGKYKCGHCDYEFTYQYHMIKHINKYHMTNPVELSCEKCGKYGISQEGFKTHKCKLTFKKLVKKVDLGNGKFMYGEWPYEIKDTVGYQCGTCGIVKKTTDHINRHIRDRHIDRHKFVCDICSFSTTHQEVLEDHRTTHNEAPKNVCDICGKLFEGSWKLRDHKYSHSSQKFNCGTCSKEFPNPYRLNDHLRLMDHKPAVPPPAQTRRSPAAVQKVYKNLRGQN